MKLFFNKIASFLLALFVLVSTISFTIEKHFCGDHLVDMSFFTDADKCAMESQEILMKKSCCKDVIDVVQGQDELKLTSFEDFDLGQQQFLISFAHSYFQLFEGGTNKYVPHIHYSPPNLVYDLQVLDQVFLI